MAKGDVLAGGIVVLIMAIVASFLPISEDGHNAFQDDELCSSGVNQMALFYGMIDVQQACQLAKLITFGIYGVGLIGIILIVVGSVTSGKKEEDELQREERYAKGEITKGEFESKKSNREPKKDETHIQILKGRYAKGEITKEEFENMKKDLE